MKKYFIPLLFIFITTSLFAQNKIDSLKVKLKTEPNNIQALTDLGIYYHDLGVKSDKKAVENGEELFTKILSLDSTNAVATAYLGSILSLKARDARMPWNKIKYAKRGFVQLDKAVQMEPENLNVRVIRAMNSYQVPQIMKRMKFAFEDFNFIINHEEFKNWLADSRAFVYLHLGKAYERDDQHDKARECFDLAMKEAPFSKSGKEAKLVLEK